MLQEMKICDLQNGNLSISAIFMNNLFLFLPEDSERPNVSTYFIRKFIVDFDLFMRVSYSFKAGQEWKP